MEIISHRGYWKSPSEKNALQAFNRSFELGLGTETDVRDFNGELVISHDIPTGNEMTVEDFFKLVDDKKFSLALNIKSDGLVDKLSQLIETYSIRNAFVFDMSVPDQISYAKNGKISFFSRASEYEPVISLYDTCHGVWLDAFKSVWYDEKYIQNILNDGKKVCIVSPELHKRDDYKDLWNMLLVSGLKDSDNVILCTDFPEEAIAFLKESK
ncbi:hypothetical protein SAMN05428971_0503 [Candidatus Pantoea varia]|uniref:Glycerophosphoryl diester phosphodiesterase n=1 Tax=Candidatus Pantoea varia TaxID=1881036 RepID=A0A1I4X4A1_9GAMM|nr:hypothetical protein [Pantoea varia]SFN20495.1 hypothetical protein SAMN05428971_0503 [Pantoea varia]